MAVNVAKQVEHWWRSSEEEFEFVHHAFKFRKTRQAMFHTHLALELALKAAVCKHIRNIPPKIHNLVRLSEIAKLPLTVEQRRFLGMINEFNISGRYTDPLPSEPTREEALANIKTAEEFIGWLKKQLSKV